MANGGGDALFLPFAFGIDERHRKITMQAPVQLRATLTNQMAMKTVHDQVPSLLASHHYRLGKTIQFDRAFQQFFHRRHHVGVVVIRLNRFGLDPQHAVHRLAAEGTVLVDQALQLVNRFDFQVNIVKRLEIFNHCLSHIRRHQSVLHSLRLLLTSRQ